MAEPENHTLRLLREFREESREFRLEFRESRDETQTFPRRIEDNFAALREDIFDIKVRLGTITRVVAGEIVQSRYTAAGIDERFEAIEKRLAELEKAK